ncbi:S-methyl-5-thioribose kinase [Paenalkalicoccus suaedae]|uniref:S-methyl-5-thioribose kinase n=2 Tax=Paenalkalicoccus suaedae TaxID=2592382 RepID=A0A859FJZ9_9BACI|nr:S-methyl-5-thioribose kinase [Paenalkalicoccus suaedae]
MTEQEAIDYAREKLHYFDEAASLSCKEIGDGNLNYVFRVIDDKTGQSLIIKQAGPVARISDEFIVSPDRNRIETDILRLQGTLAPGYVPEVYHYDAEKNCVVMEDLSDYTILRAAFLKHETYPKLAEHLSTFLVETLVSTSDLVLNHKEKKELVKSFTNPELCEITEDLVYTEPFYAHPRNDVFLGTRHFVEREIWGDKILALETAKLKFQFLTNAQALLHGDLHTGSIFVTQDATKIIDPEFAFYGPAGYDVGTIIANLIFAYVNAEHTSEGPSERESFQAYITTTIETLIDSFKTKFIQAFEAKATEHVARYDGFLEHYLQSVLEDATAVAGLELCRRIIGIAKVADITSIANTEARTKAEITCLTLGKAFILDRAKYQTGTDITNALKGATHVTH